LARLTDASVAAILAATLLICLPASALAASNTPTPKPQPTAAQVKATLTPTLVPPTVTPTLSPTATPPPTASPTPPPVASATPPPKPPTPNPTPAVSPGVLTGSIRGTAFFDTNADGQFEDGKGVLSNVDVTLTFANGLSLTSHTDDAGAFAFDGLPAGSYHISVTVPRDYVPTTDAGQDIEVAQGADTISVLFGLLSTQAAGLSPDGAAPDTNGDDEQIIALLR
jgi:hypothetical protein